MLISDQEQHVLQSAEHVTMKLSHVAMKQNCHSSALLYVKQPVSYVFSRKTNPTFEYNTKLYRFGNIQLKLFERYSSLFLYRSIIVVVHLVTVCC